VRGWPRDRDRRIPEPVCDGCGVSTSAAPPQPVAPDRGLRTFARGSGSGGAWRATWLTVSSSRLLVWVAGIVAGAVSSFTIPPGVRAAPLGLVRGLGSVGEVLAGPAARWDAGFFLLVAKQGYQFNLGAATGDRVAFFPLYPLLIRIGGVLLPLVVAGILVSILALAAGLYGLYRLTALEVSTGTLKTAATPDRVARLTILLLAFSPMAFFLSAIYSESLFLALSIWLFWCARQGRWALVGVLGALATLTRAPGLLLAVPALFLYLYGPRTDAAPRLREAAAAPARLSGRVLAALRPRYPLRWDLAWFGLIPLALVAFCAWVALEGGHWNAPLTVEGHFWNRHLTDPLVTLWHGAKLTATQIAHHDGHAWIGLSVLLTLAATVGVFRRLPLAYGLYATIGFLLPFTQAVPGEPLLSVPRFMLVVFPIWIWLAAWLLERPRLIYPVLVLFALAMMGFTAAFSTWAFVA
jgi:hypothetical protein